MTKCVVDPRSVIVCSELKKGPTQVGLSKDDQMVDALRRIVPISRSANRHGHRDATMILLAFRRPLIATAS